MCGIAGILNFEKEREVRLDQLKVMTDSLAHRGPDDSGFFVHENVGLGHRRLSIIDLSTGHQPMISSDKNIALIFNGEIYNYLELREELKHSGFTFSTESDTEVILHAYNKWGVACQEKFNGMWSFALWDEKLKQLFISRDRVGEKPLHYSVINNSFVFGSEIKSLLAYGCPSLPDTDLFGLYLGMGYIPAPYTFYKNICKLLPGHCLLVREGNVKEFPYWELPYVPEADMLNDRALIHEKFEYLLRDSVRIRMRSDVPYGAFLSGGLDSASIVSIMSDVSPHPVETFTIGFENPEHDERALAKRVSDKFKTNHHERVVSPGDFDEMLDNILFHNDEPFGDSSAIPTGIVSNYAREKVKMVLTGDGGDEVLSGYTIYQGEKFAGQYGKLPGWIKYSLPFAIGGFSSLARGGIRYKLNRVKGVLDSSNKSFRDRLLSKIGWAGNDIVNRLVGTKRGIRMEDFFGNIFSKCKYKDSFYQLMYFQFNVSLPDDMLTKVDRMSMAHSLETRTPFLDYRLIEFMAGVSSKVKMEGYERKSVLRNSIAKTLPPELLTAPKKGFVVPLRDWFKGNSFNERLSELYKTDFGLDQKEIRNVVEDNVSGKKDYGNFIWMLLVLKKWSLR